MFAFFITIHVLACSLLILIVLVQQGRGGGLIDSFSSAESIFGTKTNTFLVKATSVLAVVFFISCLSLAFLSIQKNKSLIETSYKPPASQKEKKTESAPLGPSQTNEKQSKDIPIENKSLDSKEKETTTDQKKPDIQKDKAQNNPQEKTK